MQNSMACEVNSLGEPEQAPHDQFNGDLVSGPAQHHKLWIVRSYTVHTHFPNSCITSTE